MKRLQEKYGKHGFRVVAVNAWNEPQKTVRQFAREHELPYTIIMNGAEVFGSDYRGSAVPQNYLVDHNGKIVYRHLGWQKEMLPEFEAEIQEALAQRDKDLGLST